MRMRYPVYLVCCFLLFGLWATLCPTPLGFSFEPFRLWDLLDLQTLVFLLAACALALLGTGSFRAFGRALRSMFRRGELPAGQTREGLAACRQVMLTSLLAGALGCLLGLIRTAHQLEAASVGVSLNVSLLALGYALFLDLLLAPVGAALKAKTQAQKQAKKERASSRGEG